MKDPLLPLDEQLFEHPYEFDFFQAVRLLHLMRKEHAALGGIAKPIDEPVRLKARQSLEFQPSSVHAISSHVENDAGNTTKPPEMTVAFLGLTGVQGTLPHHYTEHILARAQSGDFVMAEFFDLFNHRILSLFYRAWEKHRIPIRFQLAAVKHDTDAISQYLYDWIGMGTGGLRGRMSVPDQGLLRYAGLFGQTPACAVSLAGIIRDHFGVPTEIEQFVGAWYSLNEEDQCELVGEGLSNQLGEGAIAGDAVWDPQARFRILLGPLKLIQFLNFRPDGEAVNELRDLVRFYVGPVLQFDLQLILKADQVPWSRLGDDSLAGPQLGWCGWLKTGEFSEDAAGASLMLT